MYIIMLIRYFIIGIISTLIYVVISYSTINAFNQKFITGVYSGFTVAFLFSYIMQNKLVFKTSYSKNNFIRYLIVQLLTFSISYTISINTLGDKNLSILFIAALMAIISFFVNKKWTFR